MNGKYSHLKGLKVDERNAIIGRIREKILPIQGDFDTIVCLGFSSTIFASIFAQELNKELLICRKAVNSHSGLIVEGAFNSKCLFIDDLISSGATLRAVNTYIQQMEGELKFVHMYSNILGFVESQLRRDKINAIAI